MSDSTDSASSTPERWSPEWYAQVDEAIVDPDRRIIDPHHHLWHDRMGRYLLEELWRDTQSGHRIEQTIYLECGECYREDGPSELMPVGETEFVARQAETSRMGPGPAIAGIVARADLRLGSQLDVVLDAHVEAGEGLYRGIRHSAARDPHPESLTIPGRAPENLFLDPDFQAGVRRLGERGETYDSWHYHHQNRQFAELARAAPGTTLVLDHFGTPLGVGPYEGQREQIFDQWRRDIEEIAQCPNVVAKLGGLAMPDNGFGWHRNDRPPTSDEFVAAQERWYHHTIECFGPDRCLFESNFPVDRRSLGYAVLWNGLKKIAARYSEDEQDAMFRRNAARVYRLDSD